MVASSLPVRGSGMLQCVSLLVPYSLGNHARIGGGSVTKRLRSMLAYGWVEHCRDVDGCGTVLIR